MAEPTKIRAQPIANAPNSALVRILMSHDMETGLRSDASGKTIPAWFIQTAVIRHQEKTVMTLQCGPAVSKNPFFQFTLRNAKAGEKISVHWTDSRGDTRSDETTIA